MTHPLYRLNTSILPFLVVNHDTGLANAIGSITVLVQLLENTVNVLFKAHNLPMKTFHMSILHGRIPKARQH